MIRLHRTRLMGSGEIALCNEGKIVGHGSVGAEIGDVTFDALSMDPHDGDQLLAETGGAITADVATAAIAACTLSAMGIGAHAAWRGVLYTDAFSYDVTAEPGDNA